MICKVAFFLRFNLIDTLYRISANQLFEKCWCNGRFTAPPKTPANPSF